MTHDLFILMKSELSLTLIIFILLTLKVWDGIKDNKTWINTANVLLLINLVHSFLHNVSGSLFSGMYFTNELIATEKIILNLGTFIVSLLSYNWVKYHKHAAEFYILMISTLLGMQFMISAGNFLMFYLGLELASIPLAALVNFDLEKRRSSEGAMKMILSSAFSSGIMLFGVSLLYGSTGSISFSELPQLITGTHLQIMSLIFIFTGFAFKLSAVPFHFWTADVYEGAPAPITAYLSVISKTAMVFVFISVAANLFASIATVWNNMMFVIILLTILVGNLFAIRQQNMKRFLAFSSIAQVGYILLGLMSGQKDGNVAAIYFLIVYLFSNLAIFSVVSVISSVSGRENINEYKGFYHNNKLVSWVLAIGLFSLAGIPPTAGFFGKMFLITSGAGSGNYILVSFAALNMVISLYYYLRVIKAVFIDKSETPSEKIQVPAASSIAMIICMAGIILTGFFGQLYSYLQSLFN